MTIFMFLCRAILAVAALIFGAVVAMHFTAPAHGQVNDELNDFWLGVNDNANVTGPRAARLSSSCR